MRIESLKDVRKYDPKPFDKNNPTLVQVTPEVSCVSSLSGGIDSTVLTHLLVEKGERPLCVYIDYGSRVAEAEIRAAESTCELLDLPFLVIDFRSYSQFNVSYLVGNTEESEENLQFWSEGRNAFLGMVLASIASALKIEDVYLAINYSDGNDGYKDTDDAFIASLNLLINHGFINRVRVLAPYLHDRMGKGAVLEAGYRLGVDWVTNTHSCSSSLTPCCQYETCESCKWRLVAFDYLDKQDPFNPNQEVAARRDIAERAMAWLNSLPTK